MFEVFDDRDTGLCALHVAERLRMLHLYDEALADPGGLADAWGHFCTALRPTELGEMNVVVRRERDGSTAVQFAALSHDRGKPFRAYTARQAARDFVDSRRPPPAPRAALLSVDMAGGAAAK